MAANTPHVVFDELQRQCPIPLISIVEVTRRHVQELGLARVGLFGTNFTMEGDFYQRAFAAAGIALIVPTAEDRTVIHERYMNELLNGRFLQSTRAELEVIARRLREQQKVQAIILGGTELPFILNDSAQVGIPLIDTTLIHVEAAVSWLLERASKEEDAN